MGIQLLIRGPYGSVLAICHLPSSSYTTAVPGVFSEALDAVLQRTSRAFKQKLRSFGVYCNTISLNEVSAQPLVRHCCGCPHTSTFWSTQLSLYTLEVWFYHYSLATAYWHGVLLQHQMRALQVLVLALLAGSFHLAAARHPSRGRSLQRARPESMQVNLTRQQFVQVSHNFHSSGTGYTLLLHAQRQYQDAAADCPSTRAASRAAASWTVLLQLIGKVSHRKPGTSQAATVFTSRLSALVFTMHTWHLHHTTSALRCHLLQTTWALRGVSCDIVSDRLLDPYVNNTLAWAVTSDFKAALNAAGWPEAADSVVAVRQPCATFNVSCIVWSDGAVHSTCQLV